MAGIIAEINTIGDLIAPASNFTRFYKQTLPPKYEANTVAIRWQGDGDSDLTNVIYEVGRIYQIIYFGNSEVNCLQNADKIRTALNNAIKTKLRDSDDYMTLGSFNYSAPYKTETDGVYAIVGILPATVYVKRPQPRYPKMGYVEADVNGKKVSTLDININNGGN